MIRTTALAGLLALVGGLGLPGVAAAQQVSFDTIGEGVMGPHQGPEQELVIDDEQDFRSSVVYGAMDPNAQKPDFAAGDIAIAVFMGTQSSGGYSIEIQSIERRQLPTIQPVPGPPPAYELVVEVARTTPAPGQPVPMVITSPYHAVKLRPGAYQSVRFVAASGSSADLEAITRTVSGGLLPRTNRVRVAADGSVAVEQTVGFSGPTQSWSGTATRGELHQLEQAVEDARFDSLPDRLPDPNPAPADVPGVTFEVELDGAPTETVRGISGFYGRYSARLDPVDDALRQIEQRVRSGSTTPPTGTIAFDSVFESDMRGPRSAQETVIRSFSELQSFLDPVQAPVGLHVDWDDEMLIGVSMGQQSSGGYGVEIVEVERGQLQPHGPFVTTVTVERTRPSGPATSVITAPVHVVKVPKLPASDRYDFVNASSPSPTGFDVVDLNTRSWSLGNQFPVTKDVEIESDGSVSVVRSHPAATFAPVGGQATQAELDRLRNAIRSGDLGTVPSPLQVVIPFHVQSEPFRLDVEDGSTQVSISGPQLGVYGQWEGQLRPVIEAVQAIGDRVVQSYGRDEVEGTVVARNGAVEIQEPHRVTTVTNDEKADVLRKFQGLDVEVAGDVTSTGANTAEIDVEEILDPEPKQSTDGLVQERNGETVLLVGPPFAPVRQPEVELHGPGERVLGEAVGRRVNVEAWLFTDASGRPHEAYVESVKGEATRFSILTRRRFWTGFVRPGDTVKIERLSRSGRSALVDGPTGRGLLPLSRLKIGKPFRPTPGPVRPLHGGGASGGGSSSGPGLAGSVSNTADDD